MNWPTEADQIFAAALIEDATAHEAGECESIASRYDDVYAELLPIQNIEERRFAIAFQFWDGWCDARNHDWHYYPGISKNDWPKLARHIANNLQKGIAATEPVVLASFAPENLKPFRQRIWAWLSRYWI